MEPPDPQLTLAQRISREELAWAAGFFDGEGYTGLLTGRTLRSHVVQTDARLLQRLQAALLGLGTIDGPRNSSNPRHSPQWLWRVSGFANVQAVIAMLWIFLSEVKREQARKAITTYLSSRHRGNALCALGHNDWFIRPDGTRHRATCVNGNRTAKYHLLHSQARYNSYPKTRRSRIREI